MTPTREGGNASKTKKYDSFAVSEILKMTRDSPKKVQDGIFKFYVVQFMSVGRSEKARSMDVVCGTWISKGKKNALYCLYPEKAWEPKQFEDLNKRLEKNSSPALD